MLTKHKNIRIKRNESVDNFNKRVLLNKLFDDTYRLYINRDKHTDDIVRQAVGIYKGNTEEYKNLLRENNIQFVEIEYTKSSGKNVHMVIPDCQFKIMSRAQINKLFEGL